MVTIMTSHQHRLSTRSMASAASTASNEDEEEAYSLVGDLSSLSENVVIITTTSATSDEKEAVDDHSGRGRHIQGTYRRPIKFLHSISKPLIRYILRGEGGSRDCCSKN